MYEVELRALVDNYEIVRKKLHEIGTPIDTNEREATVFFFNPHKDDFDLRLRIQKNRAFLSFKETIFKTARKEIEADIADPETFYNLLKETGFEIKMIVARVKHSFKYNKFDILLNKIMGWGNAMEVEVMIDNENDAEKTEKEIEEFMREKIGIKNLLQKEKLIEMNNDYNHRTDFKTIGIKEILDYVQGATNEIKSIQQSAL